MFSLFCSYLSVSFYEPLVCGYFFECYRSACAQLLCADAYLSSQSELCSVGKTGGAFQYTQAASTWLWKARAVLSLSVMMHSLCPEL